MTKRRESLYVTTDALHIIFPATNIAIVADVNDAINLKQRLAIESIQATVFCRENVRAIG
jgi:hypothetical protein